MNMTDFDLLGNVLLKCSASAALIAGIWLAIRHSLATRPVMHTPATTTATTTVPTLPDTASYADFTAIMPKVHVAPPDMPEAPLAENVAQDEPFECGNCHKDVLSKPVTTMQVDGQTYKVYVCEHCGSHVKLPV
jgi:DNA-directed RNA polymerase subunit RPC12/RpoP